MAITYKKLDDSAMPPSSDIPEDEQWKYVSVEESVTQSPAKQTYSYAAVKTDLDRAVERVDELTARLAKIEEKAKS